MTQKWWWFHSTSYLRAQKSKSHLRNVAHLALFSQAQRFGDSEIPVGGIAPCIPWRRLCLLHLSPGPFSRLPSTKSRTQKPVSMGILSASSLNVNFCSLWTGLECNSFGKKRKAVGWYKVLDYMWMQFIPTTSNRLLPYEVLRSGCLFLLPNKECQEEGLLGQQQLTKSILVLGP